LQPVAFVTQQYNWVLAEKLGKSTDVSSGTLAPVRLTFHLPQAEGCGGRSAPWQLSVRKTPRTLLF